MPIKSKERKLTHSIYMPSQTLTDSIQSTVVDCLAFGYITAKSENGVSIDGAIVEFIDQFGIESKTPSEIRNRFYKILKLKSANALLL